MPVYLMDAVGALGKAFLDESVIRRFGIGNSHSTQKKYAYLCNCVFSGVGGYMSGRLVRYLSLLLVLIAATIAGIMLPRKFYECRAKNTMGEGVPAIAYIAMGMQWEEGRSPGGWNGYHSDLFMECSYDTDIESLPFPIAQSAYNNKI